jgi:hypothetical protein
METCFGRTCFGQVTHMLAFSWCLLGAVVLAMGLVTLVVGLLRERRMAGE